MFTETFYDESPESVITHRLQRRIRVILDTSDKTDITSLLHRSVIRVRDTFTFLKLLFRER